MKDRKFTNVVYNRGMNRKILHVDLDAYGWPHNTPKSSISNRKSSIPRPQSFQSIQS